MLSDCKTLDDYFRDYGEVLGARAVQALAPLHVPGRDPILPGVEVIDAHVHARRNSELFQAQGHVLCGVSKAWRRQKAVILAAQMGTGKSLMGAAASHLHTGRKKYRALVMCPDHLLPKWEREILDTCPGATVRRFADWRGVLAMAHAKKPKSGAEWFLIGRDQSKFEPAWKPAFTTRRRLKVDHKTAQKLILKGATLEELSALVAVCPRCGTEVCDKDGNPIPVDEIKPGARLTCKGSIARYRQKGDECEEVLADCDEPLWTYTRKPYRWAPARIIHSRMRRWFDYLIIDEVHETKASDSAQANAAGKLIASSRKVIAMTGTLIGGYAEHLFPLLLRLAPRSLVDAGFGWNDFTKFNARYGKIETTIHTSEKPAREGARNSQSMGSATRITKRCRPGIMPQFFGDHLVDKCVFLTLDEVSDGLPPLSELIIPVQMDPEQAAAYGKLEAWFRDVIKMMLVKGDKRLLGKFLMTLLAYPDHPFGWDAIRADDDEFTPADLGSAIVRPKEQALIELCSQERALGRQTWVYLTMTQTRDCGERLVRLMADAGLRAGYMRSSVDRRQREEWIYKKGRDLDVCFSHPKLVETGLDLFAKDGNHNFPTLAFYQTGYNLFTLRQASRRSWRIGQPLPCKTAFMYYAGTMQEGAMTLMGKKMAAAEALEGKFSAEGLAAMAGDDDATMALARALVDRVTVPADRAWSRSLGFDRKAEAVIQAPPAPSQQPSPFSETEIEMFQRLYAQLQGA